MFKAFDSALQAYTEYPSKIHDEDLNAWIDSPSLKTYDKDLGAWVERLYKYWFYSVNVNTAELDMFDVDKSLLSLNVDASYDTKTRNVTYKCSEHDIENGDNIEIGVFATVGISVSVSLSYYTSDGSKGTLTIYSKSASAAEVNETISKTISNSSAESWGELTVMIVYSYNSSTPYATAAVFDIAVNGKKYGFKE